MLKDTYFCTMQHFIAYKNIKISFSDYGKGSAVILLHGFLENQTMWRDLIPEISKNHRVITIDLLGHGDTACLGYVHTMEDQAKMVYHVLKSLKLRRFTFVGHSMGGYIALAFAQVFPDAVKGICLMNSTFIDDSTERKKIRSRAIKMAQSNYKNLVRMSFVNLFSEESRISLKTEVDNALNEALKTPVQGYIAAQEGMKLRANTSSTFLEGTFEKNIIIGKKDSVIDFESTVKFAEENNISHSILSQGHMSHLENPEELKISISQFLKRC